jgi:hypothetical protein
LLTSNGRIIFFIIPSKITFLVLTKDAIPRLLVKIYCSNKS